MAYSGNNKTGKKTSSFHLQGSQEIEKNTIHLEKKKIVRGVQLSQHPWTLHTKLLVQKNKPGNMYIFYYIYISTYPGQALKLLPQRDASTSPDSPVQRNKPAQKYLLAKGTTELELHRTLRAECTPCPLAVAHIPQALPTTLPTIPRERSGENCQDV